jgi:putative component of membrane protein insertase Oxa1/YidC/SpoIIIJ protein YidD
MNQNNLISALLVGAIGLSGYLLYKKITSKRVGDTCKFADGGADGYIVASIEDEDIIKGNPKVIKKCRRCNPTGCASHDVK